MSARRSSAISSSASSRGFTLLEIVVGLALASLVAIAVGTSYVFATRGWVDHQGRLNTQQQLRSAVAALSREVRLAGTCMSLGTGAVPADFQPLDGVNTGSTDTITVRTNPRCAKAYLNTVCNGCASFDVDIPADFLPGTWAYIVNGDATAHENFKILTVVGNVITVDPIKPITGSYPGGGNTSRIFGLEQRIFRVDSTCSGGCDGVTPTLTVEMLGSSAETPLVKGLDRLDIHYILNRSFDSSTCDAGTGGTPNLCVLNLPASATDWSLVRVVTFDVGARSIVPIRAAGGDGYLRLGEVFEITPRNAVFPSGARL